jgi:hypothetical protein
MQEIIFYTTKRISRIGTSKIENASSNKQRAA